MVSDQTIETIARALRDEPNVRALFLSGSHAWSVEDAFSDIDFLAVAADETIDEFAEQWRAAVVQTGPTILWRARGSRPMLINAINDEWLRIDVVVVTPDQIPERSKEDLKVIFDHDALYDMCAAPSRETGVDLQHLSWQFEEFIRVIGLLHVATGRAEYLSAVTGVFHLRNLLVDLMVAETGAPHRGGALHLNRLITEEQRNVLRSLPQPLPTREAAIAAHLGYAAAYLPRARRMARRHGLAWPERFEAATWRHLGRELAVERPYTPE